MLSVGLTFESALGARAEAGLVGPNAVIQLGEALRATSGATGAAEEVFASAGCQRLLKAPPDAMIDEAVPARLFEALWLELGPDQAARVAYDAGCRTGAYVLANRIPTFAKVALRAMPPLFAVPLLLKSIRKNAWTFAGSGVCHVISGKPAILTITRNPLAMPGCVWHIGVFERLFRSLVNECTQVLYSDQHVDSVPVSRFEIVWFADSKVLKDQRH